MGAITRPTDPLWIQPSAPLRQRPAYVSATAVPEAGRSV